MIFSYRLLRFRVHIYPSWGCSLLTFSLILSKNSIDNWSYFICNWESSFSDLETPVYVILLFLYQITKNWSTISDFFLPFNLELMIIWARVCLFIFQNLVNVQMQCIAILNYWLIMIYWGRNGRNDVNNGVLMPDWAARTTQSTK